MNQRTRSAASVFRHEKAIVRGRGQRAHLRPCQPAHSRHQEGAREPRDVVGHRRRPRRALRAEPRNPPEIERDIDRGTGERRIGAVAARPAVTSTNERTWPCR